MRNSTHSKLLCDLATYFRVWANVESILPINASISLRFSSSGLSTAVGIVAIDLPVAPPDGEPARRQPSIASLLLQLWAAVYVGSD